MGPDKLTGLVAYLDRLRSADAAMTELMQALGRAEKNLWYGLDEYKRRHIAIRDSMFNNAIELNHMIHVIMCLIQQGNESVTITPETPTGPEPEVEKKIDPCQTEKQK